MKTLALLSIFLVGGYIVAGWHKNGRTPISVSSIAYILPRGAFSIVMSLYTMLAIPRTLEALPSEWEFLGFLCFVGIFLVAASPYFRTEWRAVHYAGGFLFGVLSQVVVAIVLPWVLIGWLPFVGYLIACPRSEKLAFWAEVTAGALLAAALLF